MIKRSANLAALIIFILIGLLVGSLVGELLKDSIDLFSIGKTIGFKPFSVDLAFVNFTLGFELTMNLASVLGILITLLIYKKI